MLNTMPLRHVADVRVSNVDKKAADGESVVRLCNYTDVYYSDVLRDDRDFMVATASKSQIQRFRLAVGDTILTKDSETADDIAVSSYVAETADDLVCGYHLAILRPRVERIDPRYLAWAVRSDFCKEQFSVAATGVTRYGLKYEAMLGVTVPTPPLAAQRLIADFLDDQVARASESIRLRQEQVESLERRYASLLNDLLVPKEFGGGASDDGWQDRRLRSLCTFFQDGDWIESPYITDDGIRLIQTGNIGVGTYREQGFRFISEETFAALRCTEVRVGDVLISRLSPPVARACLAPDLGSRMIASVDVVIARPDPDLVHPEYLVAYLSSPRHLSDADIQARGSTMMRLSRSQVASMRVRLPAMDAQLTALDRIRAEAARTEAACAEMKAQVTLLSERKQALITAAVTGEFDVTTASGRGV